METIQYHFSPIIEQLISVIEFTFSKDIEILLHQYIKEFNTLAKGIRDFLTTKHNMQIDELKEYIFEHYPAYISLYKMSDIALRAYRSTAEISSTLIGMRHPSCRKCLK